ncbi:MAG: hypothetical protein AMJ84_06500 [Acidithiobacillales bacterium SM23_46]|nr:MAG: hypothetical protein AMJ84_06500 [Acidithiobacillales bacterium SM23_46]
MALPSVAITRFDLGSTFSEFNLATARRGFIGPQCLRPRLVGVQAADVGKIPIEALLSTKRDSRAPSAAYRRGDFEFTKFSYATDEHGWEEPMDDRKLAMYRDLLDAEAIHAQRATDFVLRNVEIDVAAALYDTDVWTGDTLTTVITNEWDDHTNAVPRDDVFAAKEKVLVGSGLEANALICNSKQFWHATHTDDIEGLIKYSGEDDPKRMSVQALATILQLDYILVAGGIKNESIEGQDASLARIWSDEYMMVARVATTDDPQEPCVGRMFVWAGDGPGAPGTDEELAVVVEEYREEARRGSVIRARNDRDIVIMYPEAAHLLSNAIGG